MYQQTNDREQMMVVLEIEPEDSRNADSGLVDAIRRDTIDALQHDNYRVQFPYTGQRGGVTPMEVYTAVTDVATYVWTHKDAIEETMNDMSALITIFGGVIPIVKHVLKANEQ